MKDDLTNESIKKEPDYKDKTDKKLNMKLHFIRFLLFAVPMLVYGGCRQTGTAVKRMKSDPSICESASIISKDTVLVTPTNDSLLTPNSERHIHVEYVERVEGYTVSADVFQASESVFGAFGAVELHFTKESAAINLRLEEQLLANFLKDTTSVDGQIISHYSPPPVADSLSWECPFFFYDVDFDGEKEILVTSLFGGPRGTVAYYIFEATGELRSDEPFNVIDSQSRFNAREKSITQNYYHGIIGGEVILKYIRQSGGSFLLTDSTRVFYPHDFDGSISYHYHRKDDEMIFVDSTRIAF